MADPTLLQVEGLQTHFGMIDGVVRAVEGLSFTINAGETVAIVGESGCGKSVTSMSILRLVPTPPGKIAGRILFQGRDLLACSDAEMRAIRGKDISMIFQEPMTSLTPVLPIGRQIGESLRLHEGLSAREAGQRAVEILTLVGIPAPARRVKEYPHQLSGGMRQRVAIAIAMLHGPDLIIADEPTTALDVTIQAQILSEVQKLVRDRGTSLVWISHDLSVVAGLADEIAVMYAGRIVEHGPVDDVLDHPQHPYTQGLIGSLPSANKRGERLKQIAGMAPSLLDMPAGCAFAPRCQRAAADCNTPPDLSSPRAQQPRHQVRCFHPGAAAPAKEFA